jgi:hypothetical protein
VLLALELHSGSGWLIPPAGCAAALAILLLIGVSFGWVGDVALYAALTVATTLVARRFWPRHKSATPDINDRQGSLLGKTGLAVGAFSQGHGRVLVDGAEWDAEADGVTPPPGGKVEVVRVLGGAKLTVRTV